MPLAPKRSCTYPGCTALTTTGRCDAHKRQPWAKRDDAPKRRAGRWLQEQRAKLFARQPLCVLCEEAGRLTVATERDHIVPLSVTGQPDVADDSLVQALCATCHEEKSIRERGGKPRQRIGADGYAVEEPSPLR